MMSVMTYDTKPLNYNTKWSAQLNTTAPNPKWNEVKQSQASFETFELKIEIRAMHNKLKPLKSCI